MYKDRQYAVRCEFSKAVLPAPPVSQRSSGSDALDLDAGSNDAPTEHQSSGQVSVPRHRPSRIGAPSRTTYVDTAIARIERDLRNGRYPRGSFMGTQRDLSVAYNVRPSVLLQATRVLVHRGLIALRRGHGGGIFASDDAISFVGKRMATYLECIGIEVADAIRVSKLFQEACVRKATGTFGIDAAQALRALMDQLANADPFDRRKLLGQMFQHFSDSSGDAVLALLYRVVTDVMLDITQPDPALHSPTLLADYPPLRLGNAVIAGDHYQSALVLGEWQQLMEPWQKSLVDKTLEDKQPAFSARKGGIGNLAERLATHVLGELRRAGWKAGERLGSEPELLARYNVSRATFRQALRLLEDYSAVETRRGPGGGLFVGAPGYLSIHDTAVALLLSHNATLEMSRDMLAQLMAVAFDAAMEGADPSQLQAVCVAELTAPAPASLAAIANVILDLAKTKVIRVLVQLLAGLERQLETVNAFPEEDVARIIAALSAACAHDPIGARCAIIDLTRRFGVGPLTAGA